MRRRWPFILAGILLFLIAVIALAPWWLGAVAKPLAARYGVTFARYERLGYGRFAVHDVQVRRANVLVTVKRAEADTPVLWSWRHWRGAPSAVVASDWSVEVARRAGSPSTTPSGWLPLRARLQRIAAALDRWLPQASIGRGVVRWPGGELGVGAATWQHSMLALHAFTWRTLTLDGAVAFDGDVLTVNAKNAAQAASAALKSTGAEVTGTVTWWDQPVAVQGRFGPQGWIPSEATLAADRFSLPGERLGLARWYGSVDGRMRVDWRQDHFEADLAASGAPKTGVSVPPLDARVRGHGDAKTFMIETLHASMPGATADLSAPVTVDRAGRLGGNGAVFSVHADLAQQPWLAAKGIVRGEARVESSGSAVPQLAFTTTAEALEIQGAALRAARVEGRLEWPRLQVTRAEVTGAGGDRLTASGGWDFKKRTVEGARVDGTLKRETLARWLPPQPQFEDVVLHAEASGVVTALAHAGRVQVNGVRAGTLRPGAVQATWRGRHTTIESFSATATAGDARVDASGAATVSDLRLGSLQFSVRGAEQLRLVAPARITWRPTLAVEELRLAGPRASVDIGLQWGPEGRIDLALKQIPAEWIRSVMPLRGPEWTVSSAAVQGTWKNGPMTFSAAGGLVVQLAPERTGIINVATHSDTREVVIDGLHAEESGSPVVNAAGRLPVRISPGQTPLVTVDPSGALEVTASSVPNAVFWQQLAAMTGVELRNPEVSANVTGTWAQPRGSVTFRAERAAMDPKRFARPMPSIEAVDVAVTADTQAVHLERFSFTVERQQVRATGTLPIGADTWQQLRRDAFGYARRAAQLRLEVPDADVAMFSRYLPAALAPAGRVQADIRFEHGALGGFLRLRNAASRPLGPLGVLQDVSADVDFSDSRVNLRRVTATSGGQPVTLTGSVELPRLALSGESMSEPRYDVALQGRNLPFVRQAGLLVRGDLDLSLQSPASGPPAIKGKVVLRDSLFLTDVRAFLPHGAGASPSRRPPYFSIETPPLNTWTLDVDVTGTRFMRMRTPVFVGVASTRFHLGGTLGEPRAIGDATIDEGQILMPFASFDVKQGAVRLTEEDPYQPQIFVRGTGRHFGYDLTMEVSGKASTPDITFTSSPALDSEQVMLMVMTGAAPSNEVTTSLTHRAVQIGKFFGQSLVGSLTGGGTRPDRLSIETGEKISRQGKETYSIEYKIGDRWSLTGEYDEFDEYNAGVKWRVAPKNTRR